MERELLKTKIQNYITDHDLSYQEAVRDFENIVKEVFEIGTPINLDEQKKMIYDLEKSIFGKMKESADKGWVHL